MGSPLSNVGDHIVEEHYCGPRNGRSKTSFDPIIHVRKGMFLLIRPDDEDVYPIWLGEALGDIELNPQSPQYKKVYVGWWIPMGRVGLDEKSLYQDCWDKKWRHNPSDLPRWEDIGSISHGWKAKKEVSSLKGMKIPNWVIEIVRSNY